MRIFLFFFFIVVFSCCSNNPSESTTTLPKEIEIPNTPEAVAQFWLDNYFDNHFDIAKKYSTASTKAMIDTIQSVLFMEEDAPAFEITALQCESTAAMANCSYVYVEGAEKIPETIELKKVDGSWLVDAQLIQDNDMLDEIELEEELEALIKE